MDIIQEFSNPGIAECVAQAVTLMPAEALQQVRGIRSFDAVLPAHRKPIYGEFEREYQRPWPGSSRDNSYAALNWKSYVYLNEKHPLVADYCMQNQVRQILALLMHEIFHIVSSSNQCRNRPECLIEHETLAAMVEHAHRVPQMRIAGREVQRRFRVVFRDYIVPLVPQCKDRSFAKTTYKLMLRRFLSNCRRRNVLSSNNTFDIGQHFANAVLAGRDHFGPALIVR
jgi:hypothetical protein